MKKLNCFQVHKNKTKRKRIFRKPSKRVKGFESNIPGFDIMLLMSDGSIIGKAV